MDDKLEQPKPSSEIATRDEDHDQDSSGDEDGGLDWTKLPLGNNIARPVIPKRGEKDFEPTARGGSGLQTYHLDRARSAMFDALRSTRAISSKSVSYAVWYPALARAHVTVARGVHFTSMGHSVQRPTSLAGKAQKRLELLPEEALYLVEKGALFCWDALDTEASEDTEWDSTSQGAPMSVQQAFAEMIGTEDLTLDRYHTFAYLRRLGYIVTRAKPPSPAYPISATRASSQLRPRPSTSIFCRVFSALFSPFRRLLSWLVQPSTSSWHPLSHRRWLHHNMDHSSIFKSLRFIRTGHSIPLRPAVPTLPNEPTSRYEVFYHVYKPNTPFRKTAPPPPDFSIVVVDASTTPVPTIAELTHLYKDLPREPLPLPRKRNPPAGAGAPSKPPPPAKAASVARPSFLSGLLSSLSPRSVPPPPEDPRAKVNSFMALRQGNKIVIVAAVDAGIVSFFRFGEGAFEEWPMA
ncbi:tRNA-splicing endonuclease subunit sen54 N-term-domain-containing protein [Gloeopeniophorella convolvens]|nr:tRNA-splicing endonuclease subunit sen54 N-term-domain-containing protein [Gloeopeniophorella convolvens]